MTEYKYRVSDFEGPLDLLLYLIEKNKVDIYNIPIVDIADQFNAYVADIDAFDVDYASKFFVMAATLLQIKSRLLLPKQPKVVDDEEDPQEVLVRQLVEYKKMKALSQAMGSLWDARSLMMGRLPAPMPYETRFEGHIDTKALYDAFQQVCQALPDSERNIQRRRMHAPRHLRPAPGQGDDDGSCHFSGLSIPRRTCRNLFGGFRIAQGRSMYDRR